ncbi:hypothetical protein BSKO_00298 [Bryopsis sp. KO-2023]|nr:hypothetical protein BSKO_00298 [Bryopsis sp. KO-2023]
MDESVEIDERSREIVSEQGKSLVDCATRTVVGGIRRWHRGGGGRAGYISGALFASQCGQGSGGGGQRTRTKCAKPGAWLEMGLGFSWSQTAGFGRLQCEQAMVEALHFGDECAPDKCVSEPSGLPRQTTMANMRQWFDTVDRDRSGHISAQELQRALAMGNMRFSLTVTAQMIRLHDADHTGTISYTEFEQLHAFLMNMQQSFQYFDQDRGGSLSRDEVFRAISHAGFNLDQPSFDSVVKAFDPDRNEQLGLPEFIAMTLFLKGCAASFGAFDVERKGQILLNFNQFVYAAANAR